VTVSLRISESAYKVLQEDAALQHTSLNTLANQIFLSYSEFDRYMVKLHVIKLSSSTFRRIINAASDEAVSEAGRAAGGNAPKNFVLAKTGQLNVGTALDFLKSIATYSSLFEYGEASHEGKSTVTLAHDFGSKGSLFLSSYVESMFKNLEQQPKISHNVDAVIIEF